jgi:hypothetical protein
VNEVGDTAGRWSLIGLGVGFFGGCINVLWEATSWSLVGAMMRVAAISGFFAAGGAAMGLVIRAITTLH